MPHNNMWKEILANLKQEINSQKESKLHLTFNSMILKIVCVLLAIVENTNAKYNLLNHLFTNQQLITIHLKIPSIIWKNKRLSCLHLTKYHKKLSTLRQFIKKNLTQSRLTFKNQSKLLIIKSSKDLLWKLQHINKNILDTMVKTLMYSFLVILG